ncbi:MAG: TRAP transporter substrate-binding protein DctP [Rhizobiaceae bacterium]
MRILNYLCASAFVAILVLASPGEAVSQDTINLKFHSSFGKSPLNMAPRWWMDEVEKRTNGKVKFTRIFGGSLGKLTAQPENAKVGAFDLGNVSVVYNPGLYSLSNVVSLPYLSSDALVHAKAAHELHSTGLVNEEFTKLNQKYMFPGMWTKIQLMSHEPVETMEDLAKQKIRAHGGASELLKTMGIQVYGIPWGELPAAAERRVVTAGIIGAPVDAYAFGFGKIFKYWNQGDDWFFFPLTFVMNLDSWNKLPADVKKVIEEVNSEMVVEGRKLMANLEKVNGEKLAKQVKIVKFKDTDKLTAARDKTWQNWVDARKKEGKDGQAVLDQFLALLKKHKG